MKADTDFNLVEFARAHVRPGRILSFLNRHYADSLWHATQDRVRRQQFLQSIALCEEDGKVAVVWSGRDCDGAKYEHSVAIVDADKKKVEAYIEHTYEWADGPCAYYIERPSVARGLKYSSRDLALEAFEEGHSHVIYD